MYTVKQLSELAGVTVRTLHYYDQIDLLKPALVAENGYRHYDDAALMRLQQILFYREIGLELKQIKVILDDPDFDLVTALQSHRRVLQEKISRLTDLIETVDNTLQHLNGEITMSKKKLFQAFSAEQQKDYERSARLQYGPSLVNASIQRWDSYSADRREAIMDEGNQIYGEIVAALEAGLSAASSQVQALMQRWHEHMRYFYEPDIDMIRGLAETYQSHPGFVANFQKLHPDLPDYLNQAVLQYADDLETALLAQMIADEESTDSGYHSRLT